MKKSLLTLGLLGFTLQTFAQFVEVNKTNAFTPANLGITDIHTVSPTIMWAVAIDGTPNAPSRPRNSYVRTDNAAGTEFDFGPIVAATNPTGYETSNIHGISNMVALAARYAGAGSTGSDILRTTNGGRAWNRVTTATQFAAPAGFNNLVYVNPATNKGFSFGVGGQYEVLVTTDAGATWTRSTNTSNLIPTTSGEYGLVRSYFARGSKVWVGAGEQATTTPPFPGGVARIFRNDDSGNGPWQTATLPAAFLGTPSHIAFRDDLNGIAMNVTIANSAISGYNVAVTSDGGATWRMVTPTSTPGNRFFYDGLDAAGGRFISYGRAQLPSTTSPTNPSIYGFSHSIDGINWTTGNLGTAPFQLISMDVLDNGAGYAGSFTSNTTQDGGIYKTSNVLPTRSAVVQKALSVYPNPSASGVFTMDLSSGIKAGTVVTVADMLGREVYRSELNNAAISARSAMVDLSKQKSGVYTLEVRTAEGNAQQKLVIQ